MKQIKNYWDKTVLVLIIAITGFLSFYAIGQEGYSNQYYAAAVKSMLSSWHNFFFASFDPGGYVTVDKPAFGLWLQSISAFIFGFHGWSIILPEALSAVVSVTLIFHIVKRSSGKAAGIASAFILGLTPILIAVSRTNNLDSSLVMVLLFATWALIVAAERGSFKLLILSMVLVGIGFNIKMLEAFMILPAFYLAYFFTSPLKLGKRILQLTGATAVLLTFSLSWAVMVDLTPADSRPYIGSSKTNSVLELALGYNGIQRVTGNQSMGGQHNGGTSSASIANGNPQSNNGQQNNSSNSSQNNPQEDSSQFSAPPNGQGLSNTDSRGSNNNNMPALPNGGIGQPRDGNMPEGFNGRPGGQGGPGSNSGFGGQGNGGGPGGAQENGQKGILRIFNKNLAGQISWFLPMALFGVIILSFKAFKEDISNNKAVTRYLILFTAWIVPMIGFFSVAGFYHRYYLSMLAPGIAALAGIGIVEMWKTYMQRGWKWLLLPAALLVTAAIQVLILSRYSGWNKILIPVVIGVCVVASASLIVIRLLKKDNIGKTIRIAIIAAFASLLIAPAVWAYTPIIYGSQTGMPIAGPELKQGDGMRQNNVGGNILVKSNNKNESSSQLVKFLMSKYKGEKYLVAVADAGTAESIILETGKGVMAIGGFSGSDNILTVEKLEQMVKNGEIRYFEIGGRGMGQNSEIINWVTKHGKAVTFDNSSSSSITTDSADNGFGQFDDKTGSGTLYDLAPEKG